MSEALKLAEAFKLVEITDIDLDDVCKNNRWGIDAAEMLKSQAAEIDSLRAEVAALKADAERGRYMIENGCWHRSEEQTHLAVLVPSGSDLSCIATRRAAIDAAKEQQS